MYDDLVEFLQESVTPFHAAATAESWLRAAGFTRLEEADYWNLEPGKGYYTTRNGSSVVAWRVPQHAIGGWRIVASHSDSPSWKIKADTVENDGCRRLSVEGYGGMIMSTWLDPRIDDLECAATTLLGFLDASGETDSACAPVWAMFDNEEVGSSSRMGAESSYLRDVLDRILEAVPHSAQASHRAMANSFMLSADNAHATHPNFPQKSDPCAPVRLGGGVVLKYNASQKYTTNAVSGAIFRAICRKADVPVQVFTNRADEAGGSTLGNLQSHMTKAVAAFYRVHLRALGDGTYTLE